MNTDFLNIEGLTLGYVKGSTAVRDLNLSVAEGELVSLLGPSGCGKTTTMRAIAGLMPPQAGRITLGGRDITRVPANARDIGLVFQSYALFPHLSVFENVAFGLRLRRTAKIDLERRVREALLAVALEGFEARLPAQLSGGQQQRVALARAFVIRPRLLLLDEPLSNLDAKLRLEMRTELRRLQRELGITMLYVTHDQSEALALSDRVIVMKLGRIEQASTPQELYSRPRTAFVAGFMGWDNLFSARLEGAARVVIGDGPRSATLELKLASAQPFEAVAWRPEGVTLGAGGLRGRVLTRTYVGERVEYGLDTGLGPVKATIDAARATWLEGDEVAFDLPLERAAFLENGVKT